MTVYIVQKLHWEWNDEAFVLDNDMPVKAFESRDDAEARHEELERQERVRYEARAKGTWLGLFDCFSGWSNLTIRSEEEIDSWLRAHDLPGHPRIWEGTRYRIGARSDWREEIANALIGRDAAKLFWEFADRVRFYEVIEVEVEL